MQVAKAQVAMLFKEYKSRQESLIEPKNDDDLQNYNRVEMETRLIELEVGPNGFIFKQAKISV